MLKEILSNKNCSACRICCSFDSYDLWETPVIYPELANMILAEIDHNQGFIKKGESFLLKMEQNEDGLFYCPMLNKETGCILGDTKPFDCRIWPFRVMDFGGKRVITLSPICPEVFSQSVEKLTKFLQNGLSEIIFKEADDHPDIVKNYISDYPILFVEKEKI